jgi:hypothetical protein
VTVTLEAGYDGLIERVFTGDLIWAESVPDRVDWVTKMIVGDGARAVAHARVNRSFKRGVRLKAVLDEVVRALGVSLPRAILGDSAMLKEFASGITLQGPAARELTRLLGPHGYDWSIQDGRLQVLKPSAHRPEEAVVISEKNGMIGSPSFGSPPEKGKAPVLTVVTLLKPGIVPGGLVQVESRTASGTFKVKRAMHQGDTFAESFATTAEAVAA